MTDIPVARILTAIADAARRWCNADFPPRVRATRAIQTRTGYTEPVVDYALDALFGTIVEPALRAVIVSELGATEALDGFVARAGRPDVRFVARDPAAIVASDTTIGVAIAPLAFALCAKARVRVKDRSDGLCAAFVDTLGEELPALAAAVTVSAWAGDAAAAGDAALGDARSVVAYGRDATLRAIRARLRADAAFTGFGHRTSVAYVARETLADPAASRTTARGLARDALLYDGEGCLSPHAAFVEGDAAALDAFARILGDAMDAAAIEFPAGYTEPDPAVVAYRNAARFRAAQGRGRVIGGTLAPHLIVTDPPPDEAPPFLRRTLALYGVPDPAGAADLLRTHGLALEAVALSRPRADLIAFAAAAGAARIAPVGELQRPPLTGEHGGAERILPFVRAIYRA